MIYLISLNEKTLARFIVLALLRRPVKVLRICPFIPRMQTTLQRVVNWAIDTGRAEHAVGLVPELKAFSDFRRRFNFHDAFKKYEPWQNHAYGFERPEIAGDPVYGYAFKHLICTYTWNKMIEVHLLDAIERKLGADAYRAYGVLDDTISMGQDVIGPAFASTVTPMPYPRMLGGVVMLTLALGFTLTWLISRTRVTVSAENVAVAFECLNDIREYELIGEIRDSGRILFVYRSAADAERPQPLPKGMAYSSCLRTDGLFTPAKAVSAAGLAIGHIFRLYRRHRDAPPTVLYEVLSLPYKRLILRGLLNRFRPGVFIGRDEYNTDHILRRAELGPLGVKSIGISNGLYPCISTYSSNIRYVSYDVYFVYAAPLFGQYLDTWAPDMEVRTIGTYSVPRERLMTGRQMTGEDIVFTMRIAWNQPEMVRMVRAVAEAFPERTIRLQFKSGFVNADDTQRLFEACTEGLANVQPTTENVYDLLELAKYHVSDLSTFVAEAIRVGAITIMTDIIDMEFNCYRQFPELCVTTAEELVKRLRALENGTALYRRQAYFELLGCPNGEIGYDALRQELGLPPGAQPSEPHHRNTA